MAYVKNIWVDQDVERPKTYEVTNNQDGSITLTDSFGIVTELGTPVNEVNMNRIEDGIDGCAIRKHNLTETFNLGEWVLGGTGDDEGIYKSLVSNNVGNAISDDTKWEKVEMGGNSRNIGEIVASTIPLTDAGLHLLDGALIDGSGSYSAFVDYIASIYDASASYFTTEANWQQSVTDYGVCDKYVYDSVNNTVRIPKRNSEHGDLIKSYKSGTNWYRVYSDGWCEQGGSATEYTTINLLKTYANTNYTIVALSPYIDSSGFGYADKTTSSFQLKYGQSTGNTGLLWMTCGYIDISDYQYSPIYEYLVVATSTKTAIQVDIDEIATDLNGKADVDLTNVNDSGYIKMAGASMPSDTYDDLTLGASGSTYTAPANGWFYIQKWSSSTGQYLNLVNNSNGMSVETDSSKANQAIRLFLPVCKNQVMTINYTAAGTTEYFRFIYAQGSESEAS